MKTNQLASHIVVVAGLVATLSFFLALFSEQKDVAIAGLSLSGSAIAAVGGYLKKDE